MKWRIVRKWDAEHRCFWFYVEKKEKKESRFFNTPWLHCCFSFTYEEALRKLEGLREEEKFSKEPEVLAVFED
jgi:hypothetical protein